MRIAVIGGTGFIGNHLVKLLVGNKINLLVTGTNLEKAKQSEWFNSVDFLELNLNEFNDNKKISKELDEIFVRQMKYKAGIIK